jgi:hypothetical protein
MATLLKVLNNLADSKSAGGVALRVRTQDLLCGLFGHGGKSFKNEVRHLTLKPMARQ